MKNLGYFKIKLEKLEIRRKKKLGRDENVGIRMKREREIKHQQKLKKNKTLTQAHTNKQINK